MQKQIRCGCGRIAEVRHRTNGKRLAYPHCVKCGGGIVPAAEAERIEKLAKFDVGKKGDNWDEAIKSKSETKQVIEPDAQEHESTVRDFVPGKHLLPENIDSETGQAEVNQPEQLKKDLKQKSGSGIKAAVITCCFFILGFGIKQYKTN